MVDHGREEENNFTFSTNNVKLILMSERTSECLQEKK